MKVCNVCGISKPDSDFARKNGGLNYQCKSCHSIYFKQHYNKRKQWYKDKARIWDKERDKFIATQVLSYLKNHACVDCNETDPLVLDFDHKNGKLFNVSEGRKGGFNWVEIEEEIKKCDIRCANCHRRKTAIEQRHLKAVLLGLIKSGPVA